MRIGIDISQIVYNTGVSRYTKELVRWLLKIDKQNEYVLFAGVLREIPEIWNYLHDLQNEGLQFTPKIIPLPPKAADWLWNRKHLINIETFTGDLNVFHSSNWAQPVCSCPKVSTIHDLTPILYPAYHLDDIKANFAKNLHWIVQEASAVIVDSEATKKDVITYTKIPADKIRVVYLAAGSDFRPVTDSETINSVKERYKIAGDYILSVGTLEPRKNLNRVIVAYEQLGDEKLTLVLTGKMGWGAQNEDMHNRITSEKIVETGFVRDDDLPALYSGAKAFIYVSEYEGFGLPVLEAMQCGCPVITSNISSLPEVAGKAGLLVAPESKEQIRKAMEAIMGDATLAKNLHMMGQKQAQLFSWEKTARQTLSVYENIAK